MRHLLFPTVAQADAFVQDLQSQGLIRPEVGQASVNRHSELGGMSSTGTTMGNDTMDNRDPALDGGTAEDAGEGAIKGTGVGLVAGAVAGVVATATTVATGGLALPVILGMAALGSGVGAGVGAIGGAAGVDETGNGGTYSGDNSFGYGVSDEHYDRINDTMNSGGRAIAVEDNVPMDAVQAAADRHGGQFVG
ncbi:hypothetical protein DKM44_05650 [Deinococcus irradiatisoli]|uniref:Uncharacterized protein n=1 Tax=Deinococcus irradiatisoli TaxID=2202254 RepID=A0A2Z3JFK8_9DEIO|nr:hypothetical protein [Deinococcus irradiatisoli]AWN22776.1 hypothetical protein DKM44_05650 [Deinococcus irradiatisoli]